MTTTRNTLIALAAAAAAAVAAAPASATILPRPKTARFALLVKGTQVTTWHFRKQSTSGACTLYSQGDGDQTIRFHTARSETVDVVERFGHEPEFTRNVALFASATRNAEQRANRPAAFGRSGCLKTVPLPVYRYPDCGTHPGLMNLELDYGSGDHVHLRGVDAEYEGKPLFQDYGTCILLADQPGRPEASGDALEAIARLSRDDLLGTRKRLFVAADATYRYPFPNGWIKTIVTYNVTLTRIATG